MSFSLHSPTENMSSASSSSTVAWLNYINVQLNRYFPLPIVIIGTIGLILNIFIFTRRSLYNNSCTHYLLSNTLANFVVLYWVVVTRIVSDGYGIDLSLTSDSFCKIRYFLTYVSRTLSTWFIVLACIDRWLSSVNANRRFNTVAFARRIIILISVICFISYSHVLALFGVQTTANSTTVTCYARPGSYRAASDLQYLIFYALGPPLIMLSFGLITLRNMRRIRRLVVPENNLSNSHVKKNVSRRSTQLLAMLLLQVAIIIIFTVPFAIQKLIDTFTLYVQRTAVEKAQYNLLTATLRLLSYVAHAFTFFTYTLSARIFRVELIKIINACSRYFFNRNFIRSPVSRTDGTLARNDDMTLTQHPRERGVEIHPHDSK